MDHLCFPSSGTARTPAVGLRMTASLAVPPGAEGHPRPDCGVIAVYFFTLLATLSKGPPIPPPILTYFTQPSPFYFSLCARRLTLIWTATSVRGPREPGRCVRRHHGRWVWKARLDLREGDREHLWPLPLLGSVCWSGMADRLTNLKFLSFF